MDLRIETCEALTFDSETNQRADSIWKWTGQFEYFHIFCLNKTIDGQLGRKSESRFSNVILSS